MTELYPETEPYEHGMLDVGDAQRLYSECCGNPEGEPALVLHGGPGSGCTPWHRRLFDPARYRVILFDQRNCGRSTPHASAPDVDLTNNTTQQLVADIERLREHLAVEDWLILGGSWGSTLALAYGETHSERVRELVLFGVTTGRHAEFDWVFHGGLAGAFPTQWERLRSPFRGIDTNKSVTTSYQRLLFNADPDVRARAAYEWCLWESASPSWPPSTELLPRFRDPSYRLAFARIVTWYAMHYAWLDDGILLDDAPKLANVPAVLINGRHDLQVLDGARELATRWPLADLIVVDDAGHAASQPDIASEIVRATDRLADL